MNIIMSQTQPQKPEIEEIICQIHKREIVAVDLDLSEKGNFQQMCCICLVEKMNNSKISTIEQTKERIQSLKSQRQENKTKQIQVRLDHFKIILDQIMEFKYSVESTLEIIYSQIKAQIFTIQKEKQSQQEKFQTQYNFQEEIRSLSEFLSSESQENQLEFQQDSQFIDEIGKQFDLLINGSAYFQTIDTFKDAKQKINEINQNNQIELSSLHNYNNQKTPSLNKLCPTHNKEIIMIDIDSENKTIEDRFVCVDCISDHPNCQYRTIEKINQQWNQTKKQQDRIFSELKVKRQEKQKNLNQQIAIMRKNYNQQLNDISEKLITEFSLPISKALEMNKFKQISLQQVGNDELLLNINQMILNDKKNLIQDSQVEYLKSKDVLFQKEIESRLEHLKQHDQLDIQVTINILQDIQNDNQIQGIVQLQQEIQESAKANQGLLIFKQDLDERKSSIIDEQLKKLEEEFEIKFQAQNEKVSTIIEENQSQFKKQEQESECLQKLIEAQNNANLELKKEISEIQVENIKQFYQVANKMTDQSQQINNIIESFEQSQKQQIIHEEYLKPKIEIQFKKLKQIPIVKPKLLRDDYWIKVFYVLQEKSKKSIKNSSLIFSTKNGLNEQSFWKEVNNKDNLLMIFQSKSDYIFGAYSPCKWVNNLNTYVQDDTLSSFIFSQTHNQIYPLKQDRKQYAIYSYSGVGPTFGGGYDFWISGNFSDGYCKLGHSYQFDQYKNQSEDPHLFGQNKPEIKECEIYQISFI
ncbi:unnamed protein product [Paramecium octaurelia]|uniref:TLDc domain-containing protein n=1 Tax=Paramecium octaurelia TaxID=43137 RepID=A0A8S1W724_PAROT|nr:unnamed protein product [Paramecium octaurelia]